MATSLFESSVGKRKSSIARVRFIKGNGKMIINNFEPIKYFKRKSLVMVVNQPLELVGFDKKYDIHVNVKGGGLSGQAGAVRLGISRNLQKKNPDCLFYFLIFFKICSGSQFRELSWRNSESS